jgi:protein-tyrosine phosphatase
VIDLHSHVLPGLDDGPSNLEGSVALGRAAAEAGTRVLAATPHVRDDHPFPLQAIAERVNEVNAALAQRAVPLEVVAGAEVAVSKAVDLETHELRRLCLGDGPYLLVESPYTYAPGLLERVLFDLQSRGFKPILAHPERSPSFLSDIDRLARIVERGVLCSITAGSMAGAFGSTVQRFTADLFSRGLAHDVASDAHDANRRPPGLGEGFARLDKSLPGLVRQIDWFTVAAPAAVLDGGELPPRPDPILPRRSRLGALLARFKRGHSAVNG